MLLLAKTRGLRRKHFMSALSTSFVYSVDCYYERSKF